MVLPINRKQQRKGIIQSAKTSVGCIEAHALVMGPSLIVMEFGAPGCLEERVLRLIENGQSSHIRIRRKFLWGGYQIAVTPFASPMFVYII
jgi:hypothetical protein